MSEECKYLKKNKFSGRLKYAALMIITALVAISLEIPLSAYAAKSVSDLKQELKQAENERNKAAGQRKEKQQELNGVLAKKNEIEEEMSALESDIDSIDSVIKEKENAITENENEIKELTGLIKTNDKKFLICSETLAAQGRNPLLDILSFLSFLHVFGQIQNQIKART